MTPTVSFVVPCYRLGHLLAGCIDSILKQTYRDFEILIMDDCSPDDTAEIARSFTDPRVKYIRNEKNLGHLRNYNGGIRIAKGEYIWLISPDDRLRSDRVLAKYVQILKRHPKVGYVFCPAVGLIDDQETGVFEWSKWGERDAVSDGRKFLPTLLRSNIVVACSATARRECYEKVSDFPLDLPYAGDWYIWCVFAMYYDVAYCAQPMVSYRQHAMSMSNILTRRARNIDNLAVVWRVRRLLQSEKRPALARSCLTRLAQEYAYLVSSQALSSSSDQLTAKEMESSFTLNGATATEAAYIRARVFCRIGDCYQASEEVEKAAHYYDLSLKERALNVNVWIKRGLAATGDVSVPLRRKLRSALQCTRTPEL